MNQNAKILLLDDDHALRLNLKLFLEDEGFRCADYVTAEDALKALENEFFDIALVDMRLPGIQGEEFIEVAACRNSALKYLIYTGDAGFRLPESLSRLGIEHDQVYSKPVPDFSLLTEKIKQLV